MTALPKRVASLQKVKSVSRAFIVLTCALRVYHPDHPSEPETCNTNPFDIGKRRQGEFVVGDVVGLAHRV